MWWFRDNLDKWRKLQKPLIDFDYNSLIDPFPSFKNKFEDLSFKWIFTGFQYKSKNWTLKIGTSIDSDGYIFEGFYISGGRRRFGRFICNNKSYCIGEMLGENKDGLGVYYNGNTSYHAWFKDDQFDGEIKWFEEDVPTPIEI